MFSTDLYQRQQASTPVTLNSLIAVTLLHTKSDVLSIADLIKLTSTMYHYVKIKKQATTYMQVTPQQTLCEKHVEGLGYRLTDKGKKTSTIHLH
jgi:hypothetical protein